MAPLPSDQRRGLETAVVNAREAAEAAARVALETMAVGREEPFPSMDEEARKLRRALRARARQLGGGSLDEGRPLLVEEIAYEQWHRMLFARFLAENGLLRHPSGPPVSLQDCAELAEEEGEQDAWALAARYASAMLPGLFRAGDPAVRVRFAPEGRARLEGILTRLPSSTFTADDALGWVYQFWQAKKKEEVNKSGRKIGGADLAPVTQLFTEDYMVRFLLENSLGAWWAARHPASPLLADWPYLRFRDPEPGADEFGVETPALTDRAPPGLKPGSARSASTHLDGSAVPGPSGVLRSDTAPPPVLSPGGTSYVQPGISMPGAMPAAVTRRPAAGTFPGWPERAAEVTVMDPCCGSGHFLVAAFEMLRRMRMEEEGLSAAEAADAVLRDNLFGLELDPRCTQIAAFAVAMAAWKAGGRPEGNPPRIACSGIPVAGQLDQWLRLARGDEDLRYVLEQLHGLFRDAPTLGSLIDPRRLVTSQGMFAPRWEKVERALERLAPGDEENAIFAQAAEEAARAAVLLGQTFTLVATNVPYLKRGSQDDRLKVFSAKYHDDAKGDLATVFVDRCFDICHLNGTLAVVSPQNWLFLGTYKDFRRRLLETTTWQVLAGLGEKGFESPAAAGAFVAMEIVTCTAPPLDNCFAGLDGTVGGTPSDKDRLLRELPVMVVGQQAQLKNPDSRISVEPSRPGRLLSACAQSLQGTTTGDNPRYVLCFWEVPMPSSVWSFFQSTVEETAEFGGRQHILLWENGHGNLASNSGARVQGLAGRTKTGVFAGQMRSLPCTIYLGDLFDMNGALILPQDPAHLPALWVFCSSPEFNSAVRRIDTALKVTNATLVKVPFDLERWQKVADELYPNGLPEPHSNDPTQWLFEGHPAGSTAPLQVAVARLLGYRWPQQPEEADDLDRFTDPDGNVCLPPVAGEQPAADRLRALLAAAYGREWSPGLLDRLLGEVGFAGKDLAAWLGDRDGFFAQHCRLFHNRPFVWHVWDGRKDGFSALVNYHKLDAGRLEKLVYTYLGSWIAAQRAEAAAGTAGAEGRYLAAQELQGKLIAVRAGEPPYDVYVRWKPLHEQPIGWEPDLNDGVRLNVRPFVTAGVLRSKFTVNWNTDRGNNPEGSDAYRWSLAAQEQAGNRPPGARPDGGKRHNDLHLTTAVKRRAREEGGRG